MASSAFIFALVSLITIQVTCSENLVNPYSEIISFIKENSDPDVIPITNQNEALKVLVNLELVTLLDVDKEWNEVEVIVWQTIQWSNPFLKWENAGLQTNLTTVNIPVKYLWTPDITLYNSVKTPETTSPQLAVVSSDGSVFMVPSKRMRFMCDLEGLDSSTGVNCTMKFGSWTYNGFILTLEDGMHFGVSDYVTNPRYKLLGTFAEKNTKHYACCVEPYEDYAFTMNIRDY